MVDRAGGPMRFDTGIERIIVGERGGRGAQLPELAQILPSREQLRAELDRVLPEPQLVRLLDDFLAPPSGSGELLLPGSFQSAFDALRQSVTEAAAADAAPEVRRAARLLRDEQTTRELLQSYRTTLLGA